MSRKLLHPSLAIFSKTANHDPETTDDVGRHEEAEAEEKEAFKAQADLKVFLCILEELGLLFENLEHSQELGHLDQLIHSRDPGYSDHTIDV